MLPAPKLDSRGVRVEGTEKSFSLLELGLSVAELALNVSCVDCTGPDMPLLSERLSQPEGVEETTRVANDVFDYVTRLLEGEYMQVAMDRLITDSRRQCPVSPDFKENSPPPVYEPFDGVVPEDSIAFLVALAITMVSFVLGLAIVLLGIRFFVRRRHRKWIRTLEREQILLLAAEQQQEDEKVAEVNASTKSLFHSNEIPLLVRYGTPLIILGNIALFLSGHLSLGGSVTIVLSFAGESYVADNFFDFSMAKSTLEIWNGRSI